MQNPFELKYYIPHKEKTIIKLRNNEKVKERDEEQAEEDEEQEEEQEKQENCVVTCMKYIYLIILPIFFTNILPPIPCTCSKFKKQINSHSPIRARNL